MEFKGSHSKRTKDYWTYLEDNYKEVSSWPDWMRGEATPAQDQSPPEDKIKKCSDEQEGQDRES
jgi:hypothetical protein